MDEDDVITKLSKILSWTLLFVIDMLFANNGFLFLYIQYFLIKYLIYNFHNNTTKSCFFSMFLVLCVAQKWT